MDELHACSAVPNFVHIFNVFHADYLSLPELDINEFENCLLPPEVRVGELHDPVILPNIVIKLLKGCGQAYVRDDTCFDILKSLMLRKWPLYFTEALPCPFTVTVRIAQEETLPEIDEVCEEGPSVPEFHTIPPNMKAEVLLVLLNCWMLNHLTKTNIIDKIDADRLRTAPIGQDKIGSKYYYLCGTRLYKESDGKDNGTYNWELLASDIEGFESVLAGLKKLGATGRSRSLLSQLEKSVLPDLPKIVEQKLQLQLERRVELRRLRSAALRVAREKAKFERQESSSAKRRVTVEEEGGAEGSLESDVKHVSTAASRAERYKRRATLIDSGEVTTVENPCASGSQTQSFAVRQRPSTRARKEDKIQRAMKLFCDFLYQVAAPGHGKWPDVGSEPTK